MIQLWLFFSRWSKCDEPAYKVAWNRHGSLRAPCIQCLRMWEAVLWTSTRGSPEAPRPSQTICYLDVKDDGWATYIGALVVAYTSAQVWGTIWVGLASGLPTLDTAGLKRLRRGHPQSSRWSGCAGGRSTSALVCWN